jgi:carbon starvation protein
MFEALFILTTIDAGTRVGRFLIQAFLGHIWKPLGNTQSYAANIFSSAVLVSAWGYFLYQGVMDPLGGINSLWPLFGIANQLLAVVALCLATTVLIKMERRKYIWVTLLPMVWLVTITFTASYQKIYHESPKIGFQAQAAALTKKVEAGASTMTAKQIADDKQRILNAHINTAVTSIFVILVALIIVTSVYRWIQLCNGNQKMDLREEPPVWLPESAVAADRTNTFGGIFGVFFFGLSLARQLSGQTDLERAEARVCHVDGCQLSESKGEKWAKLQDDRFKNPRCC